MPAPRFCAFRVEWRHVCAVAVAAVKVPHGVRSPHLPPTAATCAEAAGGQPQPLGILAVSRPGLLGQLRYALEEYPSLCLQVAIKVWQQAQLACHECRPLRSKENSVSLHCHPHPHHPPSTGLLPKELARLRMLQLVAEDLQPQGGAAQQAQQAQQAADPAEMAEARRLVQCAQVLAWLAGQPGGFERPTGRFFSEQEWRSVAAKRRDGAAAAAGGPGLFLADLAAELAAHGCDGIAYPPPSPDRLLSMLLLSGSSASAASPAGKATAGGAAGSSSGAGSSGASEAAFHAKLALLAYYLADGGFMQPGAIVQGLQ